MSLFPLLAGAASVLAAVFFCLRLNALKPENAGPAAAPAGSRVWMLIMAAGSAFHAQAVFFTQTATWTEVVLAVMAAGYSFHMWLNVRSKVVLPIRHGLPLRS